MKNMNSSRREFLKTGAAALAFQALSTGGTTYAQEKPVRMLSPITIPYELEVINLSTGKQVKLDDNTTIELPIKADNIKTLRRNVTEGEETKPAISTFIRAGKTPGVFPIPPNAVFILGGDEKNRKTYEGLAFRLSSAERVKTERGMNPQDVDLLQVVPGINYRPGQTGMIFALDADRLLFKKIPDPETGEMKEYAFVTPALNALYDWSNYDGVSKVIAETCKKMHAYTRPIDYSNSNDVQNYRQFLDHIIGTHNVPSDQLKMGEYECMTLMSQRKAEAKPENTPSP